MKKLLLILLMFITSCERHTNTNDIIKKNFETEYLNISNNPKSYEFVSLFVDSSYVDEIVKPLKIKFKHSIDSLKLLNSSKEVLNVYERGLNELEEKEKYKYFCSITFRTLNENNALVLKEYNVIADKNKKVVIFFDKKNETDTIFNEYPLKKGI